MGLRFEDNLTRFVFDQAAGRGAVVILDGSHIFDAGDPHAALAELFPADDVRAFRPRVPRFGRSCPRQRVDAAKARALFAAPPASVMH
jgi:hypothetical protein